MLILPNRHQFRFILAAACLVLTFFVLYSGPVDAREGDSAVSCSGPNLTVLIYHRFEENRYPTTNVTIERFRQQMTYLEKNGYQVIPLDKLLTLLQSAQPLPEKSVVITIDDGYRSVYENAWPVLKEFGYPFTVFLYTKAISNQHWNYMTWEMVREMRATGVDFQDHGYAHHRMGTMPEGVGAKEYQQWLRQDLQTSRQIFTEKLGVPPKVLAVPYGEYNREITDVTRRLGYISLLTQDPGNVSSTTDLFRIPREPILGNDWSTLDHFISILNRVDLPFADMRPEPGILPGSSPEQFSVRLRKPQCYLKGSLGIYVSELGWMPARLEQDILSVSSDKKLIRRMNRVAISGREKNSKRTAIRFWLLLNSDVKANDE